MTSKQRARKSKHQRIFFQVTGLAMALALIVSGVAFASLQSQTNILVGSTVQTATAGLKLSRDGATFGDSQAGFDFNSIIPGGPAVPTTGYPIYLRNTGEANMKIKVVMSTMPNNPATVDLNKITVTLTTIGGGSQNFSLQSLLAAGGVTINGDLAAGVTQQYKLQVAMAADAFNGNNAFLTGIDLVFSGTATVN